MEKETPTTDLISQFDLSLLANFVHQVVNPLNGVAGTLDNLVDGSVKEKARRDQRLKAARAQLEQCITLMRNLAFLVQGSGGVADQEYRMVVLPQVIIEAAMFFQEDGKHRGIEVQLIDKWAQNKIRAHPELVRQILMNIFDNFIKYGRKNSVVTVRQWVQAPTSMAIIEISGPSEHPIRADELKKLCVLGFRGDNARKIVASGTGLGLYICSELIERRMGGVFHIQAHKSDGIQFTIKLPNGENEKSEY